MFLSILKKAMPLPKLLNQQKFLFVGPHPDDIEVACGSTVAKLVKMGKQVTFLVVTDGRVGAVDKSLTEEQIVAIRQQEASKSAELLGVSNLIMLPYHDGGDYDLASVKKDIVSAILQTQPDVVFCPDYAVISECHPDHLQVGQVVTQAVFCASWGKLTARIGLEGAVPNITLAYYYTDKPNSYIGVKKCLATHMQAVRCHMSQFTEQEFANLQKYFTIRRLRFGFRTFKGRADGYRVLGAAHQHCFPEINEF